MSAKRLWIEVLDILKLRHFLSILPDYRIYAIYGNFVSDFIKKQARNKKFSRSFCPCE